MLLKECRRCGKLIPYGFTYCKHCQEIIDKRRIEQKKERDKKYSQKRDPKYLRFYKSKEWKALSLKKLQSTGYKCEVCGKIATEVHHTIPIQTTQGWLKRFNFDGLMSVCVHCHNLQHKRFIKTSYKDDTSR